MAFTYDETFAQIRTIIAEKLNLSPDVITAEASFKDLGADSLDLMDLVMTFEEFFGIEISDEEAEKIVSVCAATTVIHQLRTK